MARYDLPWGTTWQPTLTISAGGSPVNLDGHHIVVTVKLNLSDPDDEAVWVGDSMTGGVVILNQTTNEGQFAISMPPSATAALPNQPAVLTYDVVDVDGSGNIYETESGSIFITPRATATQPSVASPMQTHTSDYTLQSNDVGADFNTAAGPLTATMPTIPLAGRPYYVSMGPTSVNPLTILPGEGASTINGQASWQLTEPDQSVQLILVGTDYRIF